MSKVPGASMAVQKFPIICGWDVGELLNQSHTSKSINLVSLMNPKLANAIAARCVRTSGSGH